jgi:hypothetical protein
MRLYLWEGILNEEGRKGMTEGVKRANEGKGANTLMNS